MALKPLGDHIVVKRVEQEGVTESGIVIPDVAKDKPTVGEVIAVGPGKLLDNGNRVPPAVNPKQKVLFAKYSGSEFKHKGEELLVIREDDILAIVED